MYKINQKDIDRYYAKLRKLAFKHYNKGQYDKSIAYIDYAAILMYSVNSIYKDDQLEELMGLLSKQILPDRVGDYSPVKDRFVFYDEVGNHTVLTMQYLRALMSWGVEFLYVMEPSRYNRPALVLEELSAYSKATVLVLDDASCRTQQIKRAYEAIVEYRPEKAFLHFGAEGATGITLWNALDFITRYRIVPGDHHFYLGTSVSDYAIEFRKFGMAIAIQRRGFKASQVLKQPYYPIEIPRPFQGFPVSVASDCVVMFSGGAYYKTYGGDGIFFKILQRLLDENPKLIIMFAGGGEDKPFKEFIEHNHYENRLILTGYRSDISAFMEHIDIYLGTYPFNGGLMSQYAALKSKPIVQYYDPKKPIDALDGILNYDSADDVIEISDLDALCRYAKQLVDDPSYRASQGVKLHSLLITPSQFDASLRKLIAENRTEMPELPSINYSELPKRYIDVANNYTYDFVVTYITMCRSGLVVFFPKIILQFFTSRYLLKLYAKKVFVFLRLIK